MARKMKDSGIEWIGEIPEEWKLERLKWILTERKEKNDPLKTKFILSLGVRYGVVPYSEKEGGGNKAKEDLTGYMLAYPNDIVMNSMNIISGSVGISQYFGCVSPVYFILRGQDKKSDSNFYCYLFQTVSFQRSLLGLGNGILMKESSNGTFNTVRMRIPLEKLGDQSLPVPPLPEQRRIASFLDARCALIDAAIDKTRASIEEYKKLKQAIITEAVTKGVRGKKRRMKDSGIEWIGEIPEEWGLIKGKYLFQQRNEKGNKIELQLLSPTQKYGVIPQQLYEELSGMTTVKLDLDADYSSLKSIYIGDFCISLRSFQGGFEYSRYNGVVSPAYQVFFKTCDLCNAYYAYLFKEKSFIERMTSYTRSFRDGKNIAFSDFGDSLIPVPPISEQSCIAKYVDDRTRKIREIVSKKENLIQNLINYKKSIIFEYVTGKKEVPA